MPQGVHEGDSEPSCEVVVTQAGTQQRVGADVLAQRPWRQRASDPGELFDSFGDFSSCQPVVAMAAVELDGDELGIPQFSSDGC
jgi:hypothetical protein